MDLRRLKTIFIVVLVIINILLMVYIQNIIGQDNEMKHEMRENVSALLEKDMIYLAPKLETEDAPETYNCYIEKMSGSNKELVRRFLGGEYKESEKGVYENDGKKLYVVGDEFRYENSVSKLTAKEFSEKEVERLCRDEMERLGVLSEIYKFSGLNYAGEKVKVIFTAQHNDAAFFDAYISFDVSERGIEAFSGKNLISDFSVSGGSVNYYNINSVLPDLTENPLLEKNKRHTIVSIKHGYYIGKNTEQYRNILAIPVWQIATDSGVILYYDARNGGYIDEGANK